MHGLQTALWRIVRPLIKGEHTSGVGVRNIHDVTNSYPLFHSAGDRKMVPTMSDLEAGSTGRSTDPFAEREGQTLTWMNMSMTLVRSGHMLALSIPAAVVVLLTLHISISAM
jgi:hypothetical protein